MSKTNTYDGMKVHAKKDCVAPCPFHSPSDHPLKDAPIHIRRDKNLLVERICEHGVGHSDPDSVAYMEAHGIEGMGVHGCDGCCTGHHGKLHETLPSQSSSGGDKGAMSLDEINRPIIKAFSSTHTRSDTPDPIAFEEVLRAELNDIEVYVTMSMYNRILAAHNQSLQTAVTQARIDELKRVVEQLPGEHTNHGIRIGVAEAYHVLEIVIEARIAELTKAKEVNNV